MRNSAWNTHRCKASVIGGIPFEDLWNKSRQNGDDEERNRPMLNQVNDVLLNLDLTGKHDAKPTAPLTSEIICSYKMHESDSIHFHM